MHTPLTPPRWGAAAPSIHISRTGEGVTHNSSATIAEELLRQGILREDDWNGKFDPSIKRGIMRYAMQDLLMGDLHVLHSLDIVYTDDVKIFNSVLGTDGVTSHLRGNRGAGAGFFGMEWTDMKVSVVGLGKRVQMIESRFPGLGFPLIDLIGRAAPLCCQSHGFQWAYDVAESWYEWYEEPQDRACDDDTLFTREWFDDRIPEKARTAHWSPEIADRLRWTVADAQTGNLFADVDYLQKRDLIPVLEAALELNDICNTCEPWMINHANLLENEEGSVDPYPAFHLSWDIFDCPVGRTVDGFYEDCMNSGTLCDVTWANVFQLGIRGSGEGSLTGAVAAFKVALSVVKKLDTLLHLMDDETNLAHVQMLAQSQALAQERIRV